MTDPIPPTDAEVVALVRALLGFDLPPECVEGVRLNLAVLAEHGRRVTHD